MMIRRFNIANVCAAIFAMMPAICLCANNTVDRASSTMNERNGIHYPKPYPTHFDDLLQNIRYALHHDLLLQEEFYSDENLKRISGGQRIEREGNSTQDTSGVVYDFKSILLSGPSGQFHFIRSMKSPYRQGEPLDGQIFLNQLSGLSTHLLDIERVFGHGWHYDESVQSPDEIGLPATDHNGNKSITYRWRVSSITRVVSITFAADGAIDYFSAEEFK